MDDMTCGQVQITLAAKNFLNGSLNQALKETKALLDEAMPHIPADKQAETLEAYEDAKAEIDQAVTDTKLIQSIVSAQCVLAVNNCADRVTTSFGVQYQAGVDLFIDMKKLKESGKTDDEIKVEGNNAINSTLDDAKKIQIDCIDASKTINQ